ncbi:MAG: TldD/PmbA family protein [Acidobacteria bacterium]|nr:TldD/PmbA family protein [Acidobacteriota bacterium]
MVSRTRGRAASTDDVVPDFFRVELLFHERRSTVHLSRRDGLARPALLLEETGCRASGIAGSRPFTAVLDDPSPGMLRRAAGDLADALAEPASIAEMSVRERTSLWIDPIRAIFDAWTEELAAGSARAGAEVIGAKLDATISLARVVVARPRDAAPFFAARDLRATVEGRCSVTLRRRERIVTVEASRWADGFADSAVAATAAWRDAAAECVARGVPRLEAVPPPAFEGPAVFGPEATGVLLHEICGHLLEADLVTAGVSPFARLAGEKIACDELTLLDDPTLAGGRVRFLMDDEGRQARATVLIEAGVLRGFLSDDATAAATGGESTSGSRRESYRFTSLPRMTNLVLAEGPRDPEELVAPIARGLLVDRLGRGQVDPRRGEFRLEVESGRLIEGGRAGRLVTRAFLVGGCRELLRSIDGVANDVRIDVGAGSCIKDDQIVPVGQAAPSLRVSKLKVLPGVAS